MGIMQTMTNGGFEPDRSMLNPVGPADVTGALFNVPRIVPGSIRFGFRETPIAGLSPRSTLRVTGDSQEYPTCIAADG